MVRDSRVKGIGKGLYCVEGRMIRKGTVIGPYSGEVGNEARMEAALADCIQNPGNHMYYLKVGDTFINGEFGGLERFINYTCDEASRNVEFLKWSTSADGSVDHTDAVYCVATQDIEEEMWTDYGWPCTVIPSRTKGGKKKTVSPKAVDGKIMCLCKKSEACKAGEVYLL